MGSGPSRCRGAVVNYTLTSVATASNMKSDIKRGARVRGCELVACSSSSRDRVALGTRAGRLPATPCAAARGRALFDDKQAAA